MMWEFAGLEESKRFLLQSALLMRTAVATESEVRHALTIAREIASEGGPTPPLGFVFDLAAITVSDDSIPDERAFGFAKTLFRRYDDYVLGKLYSEPTLSRAGFAMPQYSEDDRARALAFLVERVVARAELGGALLNPAAFKSLEGDLQPQLSMHWDEMARNGPDAQVVAMLERICDRIRVTGALLGVEDLFELEHHLALRPLAERVGMRQAWRAMAFFQQALPTETPPPPRLGRQVATRIDDEDRYPVGGYSSLSNRGSMESLLHSQLAFMEDDEALQPDLFDVKLLRNELLYFARDENTFYRRRKTVLVVLDETLEAARVKDADLPWQRLTLVCGLILCAIRQLDIWLSEHALQWRIILPTDESKLAEEAELFRNALPDEFEQSRVRILRLDDEQRIEAAQRFRERSELHLMEFATHADSLAGACWDLADSAAFIQVQRLPEALFGDDAVEWADAPQAAWRELAGRLIPFLL